MSCFRSKLHSLIITTNSYNKLILKRNLMMSSRRLAEAVDEVKKNPYYEKYAQKISKLQETSPDEFLDRVSKVTVEKSPKNEAAQQRSYNEILYPKKPAEKSSSEIPHKKLSDIMKIELISDKSSDDIKHIWLEYHKNKNVIAATLNVEQYESLMKNGKQYPMFLFPLPRSEGYEFVMLQFAANTVHFTPLLAYQVHKENAPECLNMVHYTEMQNKDVILMRGEYDSQVINAQEAQCLANQLQMYYCKPDDKKLKLLEIFSKKPDSFKHMDLISEMENIQLK